MVIILRWNFLKEELISLIIDNKEDGCYGISSRVVVTVRIAEIDDCNSETLISWVCTNWLLRPLLFGQYVIATGLFVGHDLTNCARRKIIFIRGIFCQIFFDIGIAPIFYELIQRWSRLYSDSVLGLTGILDSERNQSAFKKDRH